LTLEAYTMDKPITDIWFGVEPSAGNIAHIFDHASIVANNADIPILRLLDTSIGSFAMTNHFLGDNIFPFHK
jgi:hypothetical protein